MANLKNSKSLQLFAELMIEKIQSVEDDWKKPWINITSGQTPHNAITGRSYNGLNDIMLFFHAEKNGYELPAYLTYKQASDVGSRIKKGEKGFYVAYWSKYYTDKDDRTIHIKPEQYNKLSKEEKNQYIERLGLMDYTVFNVQQTTIPEEKPELWKKIKSRFDVVKLKDEANMFKSTGLDTMLENKSWLCPINVHESNRAFYRPLTDNITVPLKSQFTDGESFYATLLHEMAHSTGASSRLNRESGTFFESEKYAKEELVAELTSALSSASLGISTVIREENAKYLKNWLQALKEEPKFILTILSDVHKAATMIENVAQLQPKLNKFADESVTKGKEQALTSDKESIKMFFNLELNKNYLFGGRVVEFTHFTKGGTLTFKYPENGKTFTILTKDGKGLKNIKPISEKKHQVNTENKTMFTMDDISKDELKKIGVKLSELSAVDVKNLIKGKETKPIMIVDDKNEAVVATLQLKRNDDKSVSLNFKPVQEENKISRSIKM